MKSIKVEACQLKVFGTTSPPMALCWAYQASWARAAGRWRRSITTRRWGMYGTLDAELKVQRTIKRAELTAFWCLLRKAIGPTVVHVDNKGIIDGLWRGELRCMGTKAKDADLWILTREKYIESIKKTYWWRSCDGAR